MFTVNYRRTEYPSRPKDKYTRETGDEYSTRFIDHPVALYLECSIKPDTTSDEIVYFASGCISDGAEQCVMLDGDKLTLITVYPNDSTGDRYNAFWIKLREWPRVLGLETIMARLYSYSMHEWKKGALELLWKLRNAELLHASSAFAELLPLTDWVRPDFTRAAGFSVVKPLPRNIVSMTFSLDLGVPVPNVESDAPTIFMYCVHKATGFDFWLIPTDTTWVVVNAGFLTELLYWDFCTYLTVRGKLPEEEFAFITCESVPEQRQMYGLLWLRCLPFADPRWNAGYATILATLTFHGELKVIRSSIPLEVVVPRKILVKVACKFKKFQTCSDEESCFRCDANGPWCLPACQFARCPARICFECTEWEEPFVKFTCNCGEVPTALFWKSVDPKSFAFLKCVPGDEDDEPETLFNQCVSSLFQMHLSKRTLDALLPARLAEIVKDGKYCWEIKQNMMY